MAQQGLDQQATLTAVLAWKATVESDLQSHDTSIGGFAGRLNTDEQGIASHQAQLTALQNSVTALQTTVATLQKQLAAMTPATSTITFTGMPNGPLNGVYGGANFGTGLWQVTGGELQPVADGVSNRAITWPNPVAIVSLTFSTTTTATTAMTVTASNGAAITFAAGPVNQDAIVSPAFAVKSASYAFSKPAGSALDLRIRQIVVQ